METVGNGELLIDTSVLLSHFRDNSKEETEFERAIHSFDSCFISTITVFEVEYGAYRAGRSSDLSDILKIVEVLPFGQREAKQAAKIHSKLTEKNKRIGVRDVFIAGICLANDLPILTENEDHFNRVDSLRIVEVNT